MTLLLAFLIGGVAGLRAMTAIAAASWAARLGALRLGGTWLAFLGVSFMPWILSALAIGELVTDQSPKTPSRKVPIQFAARICTGAISGAAVVAGRGGSVTVGLLLGAAGAVAGTELGAAGRTRLATSFGQDRPAALIEDAVAIGSAAVIAAVAG